MNEWMPTAGASWSPGLSASRQAAFIVVRDMHVAKRFYVEGFRWSVRIETTFYCEFELPDGRGLALYQRKGARDDAVKPRPRKFYVHVEDLQGVIARLESLGAPRVSQLRLPAWADLAVCFLDPDGTVVGLVRPLV